MLVGCEQWVISRANRIISVCSGRWQGISLQVNETVTVIGLHLSSHTELRTVESVREITDGTVMKIGRKIMSLVVFSSSHPACVCARVSLSLSLFRVTGWRVASQSAAY